jgi:tryptophan halogenase
MRLLKSIEGDALTEPRIIRFRTGRRLQAWNRNCIALGLASGFVEPLESTSIHLIMLGVTRLMGLFPFAGINQSLVDEYNLQTRVELEKIRDFIVLHYHLTQREDSPFWRYCNAMIVPETLQHRIDLFTENAQALQKDGELFRVDSWTQVMLGQGIVPRHYHHIARTMSDAGLKKFLNGLRESIHRNVREMPQHQAFVDQYCKMDMV